MSAPPIRVLHVVGGMNRGGVETWLMHVLRNRDPHRLRLDFLANTDQPSAYDDEIRDRGGRIFTCPGPHRLWKYARAFRRLLAEHGPFDVLHSHVHHFSGALIRLARSAGVPIRVAHGHTDTRSEDAGAGLLRRGYLGLMRRLLSHHATHRLAASREAAHALFGMEAPENSWQTFYCGVDLTPFRQGPDRAGVRAELGFAEDAFIVGHVGRFVEVKNHKFLLDVLAEVSLREPRARMLLVGDGPLRAEIEGRAGRLGLAGRVRFLGARPDVPRLMGAMDVFVLPSRFEGLPLVGMEVQAADVPLVLSDTITSELDVVPGLIDRLSLSDPAATWAEHALALGRRVRSITRADAWARLESSPFNILHGVEALTSLYEKGLKRG